MKLFGAFLAAANALQCDEVQGLTIIEAGSSEEVTVVCTVDPDEIDDLEMEIVAEAPTGEHQKIIKVQDGETQHYNIEYVLTLFLLLEPKELFLAAT